MTVDIFAPDWNVWDWVDKDLEEARRIFHVSRVFSTSGPPLHSVSAGMSALYQIAMTPDDFFKQIGAYRDELASTGVRRLGVYGSVARGEARSDSDVDVLVEFDKTPDLFELAALRDRLVEILGRPVDLTTPQGLKPRLRARILGEVRYAA